MRTGSVAAAVVVAMLAAVCAAAPAGADDALAAREAALGSLLVVKLGDEAAAIRVTLSGDKAILTGTVERRRVQELAEEVALTFPGVASVDNQVVARRDKKMSEGLLRLEAKDSELETAVKMRLRAEIGVHAERIEVEAVEGWVTLRGAVPDAPRREIALKTTLRTKRVAKVIDLLRIAE